jgi:hypothetical protein
MADRVDFYFRQRVTEAELDLAFALLEKADRDLAADLNIYGIVSGAVPAPHSPVPDLTVDLTAPARAYDNLGQRMFFGTGQTVDCAVDLVGIPTDVATVGNERWLGIFLRFKRQLSDPRTDGNSQQVFFRRDESFELVVRQAPEGAIGVAPKPALQADELLLCDVRRRPGQTQILVADLDTSRRQAFIFAQGTSVAVTTGTWSILQPARRNGAGGVRRGRRRAARPLHRRRPPPRRNRHRLRAARVRGRGQRAGRRRRADRRPHDRSGGQLRCLARRRGCGGGRSERAGLRAP